MARGDVLRISFPQSTTPGNEQIGTRPAIAVEADIPGIVLPTLMVVPLTSNRNALRFGFTVEVAPSSQNGLTAPSVALCFQLRAIDRRRIVEKLGELEQHCLERISQELTRLLGL